MNEAIASALFTALTAEENHPDDPERCGLGGYQEAELYKGPCTILDGCYNLQHVAGVLIVALDAAGYIIQAKDVEDGRE